MRMIWNSSRMSTSDVEQSDHYSVMLDEAIDGLNIRSDGLYVDATFGRGGHSAEILRRLTSEGRLILLDRDPDAITVAQNRYESDPRVTVIQSPFSALTGALRQYGIEMGAVDGLLVDLGVSSPQLDNAARGFSFMQDGPLDMRMNPQQGESAADWLNQASAQEIAKVLWEYGEERLSRKIARAIVHDRVDAPLTTTKQLASLISRVVPGHSKKHPATRSFQAIRIHVNRELEELTKLLEDSLKVLVGGGRMVVISFHSLEDRMVKRFINRCERGEGAPPPEIPLRAVDRSGVLKRVGKARFPSNRELEQNPRSRSAVMRVAERVIRE